MKHANFVQHLYGFLVLPPTSSLLPPLWLLPNSSALINSHCWVWCTQRTYTLKNHTQPLLHIHSKIIHNYFDRHTSPLKHKLKNTQKTKIPSNTQHTCPLSEITSYFITKHILSNTKLIPFYTTHIPSNSVISYNLLC